MCISFLYIGSFEARAGTSGFCDTLYAKIVAYFSKNQHDGNPIEALWYPKPDEKFPPSGLKLQIYADGPKDMSFVY